MKFQIILELSEKSLKWCGISFRIAWRKEARSLHSFFKFFEVRRLLRTRKHE